MEYWDDPRWKPLQKKILKKWLWTCLRCGEHRDAFDDSVPFMQVDHIRPRELYPQLTFDEDNLQVLCPSCNKFKGIKDGPEWDFRQSEHALAIIEKRKKASEYKPAVGYSPKWVEHKPTYSYPTRRKASGVPQVIFIILMIITIGTCSIGRGKSEYGIKLGKFYDVPSMTFTKSGLAYSTIRK